MKQKGQLYQDQKSINELGKILKVDGHKFMKQWSDLIKSVDIKNLKRQLRQSNMDLESTRSYAECWLVSIDNSMPDQGLDDIEQMIFSSVKREWSEACSTIFDRKNKKIWINQTDILEIYDLFDSKFLD